MRSLVVFSWNYLFNHNVNPLRHIQDIPTRHMILQILGWMWAASFAIAIGSYTFLAISLVGHIVLIAAAAITVATYTVAEKKPVVFARVSGRRADGEHE